MEGSTTTYIAGTTFTMKIGDKSLAVGDYQIDGKDSTSETGTTKEGNYIKITLTKKGRQKAKDANSRTLTLTWGAEPPVGFSYKTKPTSPVTVIDNGTIKVKDVRIGFQSHFLDAW